MESMKIGDSRIPNFKYCNIYFLIVTLQTELDLDSQEASERIK